MLGYIVAFVASCFNRKMMQVFSFANTNVLISCNLLSSRYRFPSVLVLYWLAAAAIYDIINLFTCCTSEDYFQNQNHPSYSCLLQGQAPPPPPPPPPTHPLSNLHCTLVCIPYRCVIQLYGVPHCNFGPQPYVDIVLERVVPTSGKIGAEKSKAASPSRCSASICFGPSVYLVRRSNSGSPTGCRVLRSICSI